MQKTTHVKRQISCFCNMFGFEKVIHRHRLLVYLLISTQYFLYHSNETEKESIIEELKELGNGQTLLPYFSFFTENEMKRRSFEETLSSRTEKIPPFLFEDPAGPTRSRTELTLLKAISYLRKDKYVWKITLMTLLLEKLMEPEPPVAKLHWWEGPERIYVANIIKLFEGTSTKFALRDDVKSLMKAADEQQEMVEEFEKSLKHHHGKTLKKKYIIPQIVSMPMWSQPMTSKDVFNSWYNGGIEQHREKRSVRQNSVCVKQGSSTKKHMRKQKLARLCDACVNDIDLGPNVVPRYIKSVECKGGKPSCLLGDGVCVQKMIHATFQRLSAKRNKDGSKEMWKPYKQPLNTSCECQCRMGSLTQMYFMN